MAAAVELFELNPRAGLICATQRELLNVLQADSFRCYIISVTDDILKKLDRVEYGLSDCSIDTLGIFCNDAKLRGMQL